MNKPADSIFKAIDIVMVACLCGMVAMVFLNVVLRYGFNSGISSSEELSRMLFVWLTFLGAIAALRNLQHLGVDALLRVLPHRLKKGCAALGSLLMLAICALLAHGSWKMIEINLDNRAPVTGVPVAVMYVSGLVFAAAAVALLLVRLYRVLFVVITDDELVGVKDSEELFERALVR